MAFAALFQGRANPRHVTALRQALITLAREALQEPDTIRYEFYQPAEDPTAFLLFAIWADEAAWKAHVTGEVHVRYVQSLPTAAWAVPPVMTRLHAVTDDA